MDQSISFTSNENIRTVENQITFQERDTSGVKTDTLISRLNSKNLDKTNDLFINIKESDINSTNSIDLQQSDINNEFQDNSNQC